MKKMAALVASAVLLGTVSSGPVLAFTDLEPTEKEPIMQLKERGLVSGVDGEHFAPRGKINFAQGISLIVKGLKLSLDETQFVKKPEASDYFTNVPNDAWYAEAFVIAKINGLNIPQNVDPNASITREQYADLLIKAMDTKGSFPVVRMMLIFEDDEQVGEAYRENMQRIYLHKIAQLGEDRMAYPKREITRGEAALWLHNTIKYVESREMPPKPDTPQQGEVNVVVEKVNEEVNKVTLSRGDMPNPGYGITINGIRFEADDTAVISYTLVNPKPDHMHPQVITPVKAHTYVPSKYTPVAENSAATVSDPATAVIQRAAPAPAADPAVTPPAAESVTVPAEAAAPSTAPPAAAPLTAPAAAAIAPMPQ
ncbi:S-layer homology domain-containing protein [Paenibacillus xerothermodurans]|uniref:S-layer homology domain-containing protein n=1 Tax=Paenibacillus xerothermodurans TaxID=1977292 RepID=A0A2W1NRR7_PAEXE|nr:S-layer homology domain-containing protein [Paenibacillus xerothermodurans]PZE20436.1 S-layer homology domain-containing protein [Paenibacillus xerothermodurans]